MKRKIASRPREAKAINGKRGQRAKRQPIDVAKGDVSRVTLQRKPTAADYERAAAYFSGPRRSSAGQSVGFDIAKPPPGVLPKGHKGIRLAFDEAIAPALSWASATYSNLAYVEGWTFLGYPYLAALAQIPEYRLISEVISTEATRKWIEIRSVSDDDSKSDRIKELEIEMERLDVRASFKTISEQDGFFGRSHLYLDTGATDDLAELKTPLGDGDSFTEKKLGKGDLKALRPVEAVWCYPSRYNANDPLKPEWYQPEVWFAMGKEVHRSRLLTFVARPVPDLLKPAFSFGGLSLSQMAKPYVDIWLNVRQSAADLVQAFSTMVVHTDVSSQLTQDGAELEKRIDLFTKIRNNRGVMVVNKDSEDLTNVAVPLSSLPELVAQMQEHMASISRIPLVKLLGIQPAGLNASSEGEIRTFYDTIHAYQEFFFGPHLKTVFRMAQINIWGQVDDDLTYVFKPLWELDEKTLADLKKTEADTDVALIDAGVLAPKESRQRLADDPDQDYGTLDVDDVPEPALEPGNIHEQQRLEGEISPQTEKEAAKA